MKIKVLFDKLAINNNLFTGWGVSFLINDEVLFDTGEKGEWLVKNMKNLRVDLKRIKAVVISHDHWDHTGGLQAILSLNPRIEVYSCPNFSKEFKEKIKISRGELKESSKFLEISRDIFVTGEIPGAYRGKYMPEQAVVLKTKNGVTIITGCAHPGILKIIEKAKAKFLDDDIYAVFGGFHLKESDKRAVEIAVERFREFGVINAGPTHCSGEIAEELFKKEYGNNFMEISVGKKLEV